jgi:hypothetical protein
LERIPEIKKPEGFSSYLADLIQGEFKGVQFFDKGNALVEG